VVTVGTTSGKVQRINIRATTVVNFDRQEIIVPNRNLITKEVINWTRGDTIIRLVVPIGVAYGSDIDEVTDLLLEIAREQPEINKEPEPQAFFLSHGESSLDFELRVFIPNPAVKMPLLHRLNRTINRRLADRGIEIPFPQRDLHIRSSAVPWPARNTAEAPEDLPVESS
jgi:potassium efflux system protein